MIEYKKPEWWRSTMSVFDMLDNIEEVGCNKSMDLDAYYCMPVSKLFEIIRRGMI